MSNFSQNGINFTIENNFTGSEKNHPIKGKLTSLYNDYSGYEQDDASKLINAVEIDWNSADFAGMSVPESAPTSINTTGDLLKTIKYAANGEIFGKLVFAKSLREPHSSQRLAKRYEKV